ncbi:MAG TPA: hypothetical protein VHV10_02405 [Ktedonobacteraceae bacterium]|jgi:hypothetical protein|nr:hypothetical protein [Ktedonobacteraceae bacterium]
MNDSLIQAQRRVERFRLNEDLEDVLNESMADFEDNPVYDTIVRWICRFPQYADEIFYYIECVILCDEEGMNE